MNCSFNLIKKQSIFPLYLVNISLTKLVEESVVLTMFILNANSISIIRRSFPPHLMKISSDNLSKVYLFIQNLNTKITFDGC